VAAEIAEVECAAAAGSFGYSADAESGELATKSRNTTGPTAHVVRIVPGTHVGGSARLPSMIEEGSDDDGTAL
jgi:hypothetical protein